MQTAIYLLSVLLTFLILLFDKTIVVTFLNSVILKDELVKRNKLLIYAFYSVLSPITLTQIILIKIKENKIPSIMKYIKAVLIIALLGWGIYSLTVNEVGYYNRSVNIEQTFNQKLNERLSIINKALIIPHQKLELARMNDTSYTKIMTLLTSSRKDGVNLAIKLTMESNPMASFSEVTAMYADVSASIDANRNQLFGIETQLQSLQAQYAILHREIPSGWYLFYQPKTLNYIAISTTANKVVNETGVDNNINIQ
jgi:hypothetical protein